MKRNHGYIILWGKRDGFASVTGKTSSQSVRFVFYFFGK